MSTSLIFGILIIIEGIVCMKSDKYFLSKSTVEKYHHNIEKNIHSKQV